MTDIYFKHLSMTNFMSYEHAELDLNREGNIFVGGLNKNPEDSAKSNGCGKSTIFSAVSWALTGETISGAKDVANIYLIGKTEVKLTFEIDGVDYEIRRTKNPSNLFFFVNGENVSGKGVKDTKAIVSKYIPQVTSSLLNSVIILGQGLPQKFTNNSPSGRKEVLEKLSNSDFMVADLKDKLTARKNELTKEKRKCEDFDLQYRTTKETLEHQVKQHEHDLLYLEDADTLQKAIYILETEIDELEKEKEAVEELYEKYDTEVKDLLEEKVSIYKDNEEEYKKLPVESTDAHRDKLMKLNSSFMALNSEIKKLESVTDTCPTCGQKLPDVHKIDTGDKREELGKIGHNIEELKEKIREIEEENNRIVKEFKEVHDEKIKEVEDKVKKAEHEQKTYGLKLSECESKIKSKTDKKTELTIKRDTLEEKKKSIEDEIVLKKKFIEKHNEELYKNNEELTIITNKLAINSKMLTLIQRDFRGYLLNNVISFIEDRAKIYSAEVFGTDKLSFKLEKNNIDISYDCKDYSCLSGGEKQKLDVIIQFAIRDMLCTFLNFSSNILVLDEITDALDSIGVSKIFNLINSNLSDVEAIYIISHHVDELEIPADDEIIIIKGDDKISRII